MSILKKYGYLWVTGLFFLVSITLQWLTHDGPTSEFVNAVMENWQSEFLQLMWQVGGLMLLYAWGSSQSREETEKQDALIEDIHKKVTHLCDELRDMKGQRQEPDQFKPLATPGANSKGKPSRRRS